MPVGNGNKGTYMVAEFTPSVKAVETKNIDLKAGSSCPILNGVPGLHLG